MAVVAAEALGVTADAAEALGATGASSFFSEGFASGRAPGASAFSATVGAGAAGIPPPVAGASKRAAGAAVAAVVAVASASGRAK